MKLLKRCQLTDAIYKFGYQFCNISDWKANGKKSE